MKERTKNTLDFKKPSQGTVIVAVLLIGMLIAGFLLNKPTGNSPDRDKTWGQMYREIELRLESDGKYHFIGMGTGAVGDSNTYDYAESPELFSSPEPRGGIEPPQRVITKPTGEPYSSAANAAKKYYRKLGYDGDIITIQAVSSDYSAEGRDFLNKLKDETVTLSVEFSTDPRSHKIRLIVLTREKTGEWDIIKADE